MDWEKILANYIYDKGSISKTYKELINSMAKTHKTQFKK
jgi:hypothetical protein